MVETWTELAAKYGAEVVGGSAWASPESVKATAENAQLELERGERA